MNKILASLTVGLVTLVVAGTTVARPHGDFIATAPVTSVTPLYETVRVPHPVEKCWHERVVHPGLPPRHEPGGVLAGGIIGGLLGHQIGEGSGKTAATIGGTLLGATVGHDLGHRPGRPPMVTHERRCEVVERFSREERLVGYRVEYRYNGQTFVTHTDERPGKRIRVHVAVDPLDDRDGFDALYY